MWYVLTGPDIQGVLPWMSSNGHPAHLSPDDPHDRRFKVASKGKPTAVRFQNEQSINLQRGVGLLPPGPSSVGNRWASDQGWLERVPGVAARRAVSLSYSDIW